MNDLSSTAALPAAPSPPTLSVDGPRALFVAAGLLLPYLERGRPVDAGALRAAMEAAFGASDASGAWDWKTAYDACEAATVLFLRKYGRALFRKAGSPAGAVPLLAKVACLLPTHTRRSTGSETFQQFSTPIPLGLAASVAAAIAPADCVLEPSAGTGLLAILAEVAGGKLVLNELAETRAKLLASLFPAVTVTRFDAAQIDDHLGARVAPSVVLMNPPFSVMANVRAAWPTPLFATSLPRWGVSPMAGGWSRSPARTSRPMRPPGGTPSFACRKAGAWSSQPRSMALSMQSMARRSIRA